MENLNETLLWKQFKSGDEKAFELIYHQHYPGLFAYGLKLYGRPDHLEDSIQDLFLKLWKNKENLGEVHSMKAYLFKSFRRISMNSVIRSRKADLGTNGDNHEEVNISVEDMVIHEEINGEQNERLQNALLRLTKRQKEIIYLKFYQGFSYEEIEEVLQINYQTIRNCVYEAIKSLKKDLVYVTLTLAAATII